MILGGSSLGQFAKPSGLTPVIPVVSGCCFGGNPAIQGLHVSGTPCEDEALDRGRSALGPSGPALHLSHPCMVSSAAFAVSTGGHRVADDVLQLQHYWDKEP